LHRRLKFERLAANVEECLFFSRTGIYMLKFTECYFDERESRSNLALATCFSAMSPFSCRAEVVAAGRRSLSVYM
jgi:hypothetical protein